MTPHIPVNIFTRQSFASTTDPQRDPNNNDEEQEEEDDGEADGVMRKGLAIRIQNYLHVDQYDPIRNCGVSLGMSRESKTSGPWWL